MTTPAILQRNGRPISRAVVTHIYAVGQSVQLKGGFRIFPYRSTDVYRVTARLPARGNMLQYRIRNEDERHERVTTEDTLEPVPMLAGGSATLMEKTFGHG